MDGFHYKFTTVFDIVPKAHVRLHVLWNNGLEEGELSLVNIHLCWILEKEDISQAHNLLLFKMDNEIKKDIITHILHEYHSIMNQFVYGGGESELRRKMGGYQDLQLLKLLAKTRRNELDTGVQSALGIYSSIYIYIYIYKIYFISEKVDEFFLWGLYAGI